MRAKKNLASLVAMLVLGVAVPASAQDLSFGVKFTGGAVLNDDGGQTRTTVGLAVVGEYKLDKVSTAFAELRYRDYRSTYHEATRLGAGYLPDGTLVTPNGTTVLGITKQNSVDMRRDTAEGLGLALGYRRAFWLEGLSWQAGLSADYTRSQQEVTGQITVNPGNAAMDPQYGLNFTPHKTSITPGLFAGLHMDITPNFFVEANAQYVSFKQVNYLPQAYTGKADATETTTVKKVSLEVSAGFRF
jgi:opacity protein-like surface antigen